MPEVVRSDLPHVVVIGGGGTGGAVAHDLALRGLRVTVLERGEITSGTTGRHHGLLHSGGRYAVGDKESAVECITENRILRRIAPGSFEENDGLFVAITDEDMDYLPRFVEGCEACDIPATVLTADEALRREPGLTPDVRAAVQVPDGTMDAMRLPLRFFATAQHNGAVIRTFTEVVGLRREADAITAVAIRDYVTGEESEIAADLVINASGPWAQRIADMAGVEVPIRCSPGVLVAVRGRWCDMVVNRLHPSGDGDIVLPQRGLCVIGTSSWVVDDPDELHLPEDHIRTMFEQGARLVPAVAGAEMRAAWSAVRPLIGDGGSQTGRELSRTFKCFDHAERDGVRGFITISGGKATTLRAMAEATVDVACRTLGVDEPCRTRDVPLLPHTAYYTAHEVPEHAPTIARRPHRSASRAAAHATGSTTADAVASAASTTPDVPGLPTRDLRVSRWKTGWTEPVVTDYLVPVEPATTVLDALRAVRWHTDPTLTVRHSCSHSSCGTCGVRVNGAAVLGCVTRLEDLPDGVVTIEPIANAAVVSDLVVDMTELYDRLEKTGRPLIRASRDAAPDLPTPVRLEDCVECGLCVSACPITATDPDYLGPAVLGAAWRAVAEPRGTDPRPVLDWVDDHQGCWRCHLSFACSQVCPTDADPAAGIMNLRGALTRQRLTRRGHDDGAARRGDRAGRTAAR
ncbi:FAD-dependent oxidoreductase [Cellulomonas sp. P24]|uniref:FAD-dependent oxidoreductase n=1 Tax=Cellulomonas sp. P24 TaxID=2885206 RepID=UPI00216B5522|nr:FAD-dependent oxidoreductase [Cellulomonas sp. P24]MCR6493197.1 FAD-dependent oxidoreductase [Cellulomonas sp. P24]